MTGIFCIIKIIFILLVDNINKLILTRFQGTMQDFGELS